jgi:fido (protein-threonine AMPylation protein)
MKDSLHNTLAQDGKEAPGNFTIRLADYLREEFRKHNLGHDPIYIIDAAKYTSKSRQVQIFNKIWERIEDEACRVVYGSNLIEDAGASFDYTVNLCQQIFRGQHIDAAVISQRSPEYAKLLGELKQRGQQMNYPAAIRTWREIIQHAQALSWAIENIVLPGVAWTEDAVRTIHSILYADMANDDIVPGEYRGADHAIAAKHIDPKTGKEKITRFIHPRAVPSYMATWVETLNSDIQRVESGVPFDPYDLSAKHYHHFVNIHPFGDGNGRTSRIILNCLVLRFTGHLIPVGENDKEKDEYLGIAARGAKKYHEEDGEVYLDEQKGHREMAMFMARKPMKNCLGTLTGPQ